MVLPYGADPLPEKSAGMPIGLFFELAFLLCDFREAFIDFFTDVFQRLGSHGVIFTLLLAD
jgi:hypothetical protein